VNDDIDVGRSWVALDVDRVLLPLPSSSSLLFSSGEGDEDDEDEDDYEEEFDEDGIDNDIEESYENKPSNNETQFEGTDRNYITQNPKTDFKPEVITASEFAKLQVDK
jgi:hypothetical protein